MTPGTRDGSDEGARGREREEFVDRIGESESVTEAVVRAVAAVTGKDPTAMEPLGRVLDPEALEDLFDRPSTDGRLRFEFNRCRVTIDGGTRVRVRPKEDARMTR
jgi:hypothetical protein